MSDLVAAGRYPEHFTVRLWQVYGGRYGRRIREVGEARYEGGPNPWVMVWSTEFIENDPETWRKLTAMGVGGRHTARSLMDMFRFRGVYVGDQHGEPLITMLSAAFGEIVE